MKILKIALIVLTTLVGGCFVANLYGWHRMKTGYEVKAKDEASYLQARLEEDLGYSGFEHQSLQKAWVNGFREHTYLYLISPTSIEFKSAIEKVAGTEPISASYFRNGGYLGPSTAPRWWDSEKIDEADALYFRKESHLWRFTWIEGRLYIVLSAS